MERIEISKEEALLIITSLQSQIIVLDNQLAMFKCVPENYKKISTYLKQRGECEELIKRLLIVAGKIVTDVKLPTNR